MSTNVKRATTKDLLPDYYSILAIIFNIIHVFFSKTFFVLFCFPSNMAAKYAVRHVTSRESGLLECDCIACSSFMITSLLQVVNKFDVSCFEFANIKLHQV